LSDGETRIVSIILGAVRESFDEFCGYFRDVGSICPLTGREDVVAVYDK
jgi:hypothetical protein